MKPLILASGSPRRRELFALLGLPFQVFAPRTEEIITEGEEPREAALRLALAKAKKVASHPPDRIIVSADTLVVCGDRVLGKPRDEEEASAVLQALRGKRHRVISGVVILDALNGEVVEEVAETVVWMRNYTTSEITCYISRGEPFDKAGGYAIQDGEFRPAARVEGCYANVMGLPLCHLYRGLRRMGLSIEPPAEACQAFTGEECQASREPL